jgi:hypothetical protein
MTAIVDLQAELHNSIPYVHIGIIMDLYSRSMSRNKSESVKTGRLEKTIFYVSN